MLDFKELNKDGNDFEILIRELLFSKGFEVFWSGKGQDGGKDILCIEKNKSLILDSKRKWLVQCKHFAHDGRSVGIKDLDDVVDTCTHHKASGYLLVCSTYPSSKVIERLDGIKNNKSNPFITAYWDYVALERLLFTPNEWRIAQRFFPISANTNGWQIYSTERPNGWVVNFKGYFFHVNNRIGSNAEILLSSVDNRIKDFENVPFPNKKHSLRPRAVYFDDKNGSFVWYLDYLYPHNEDPAIDPYRLKEVFGDEYVLEDGQFYSFDVQTNQYNDNSEHFDLDHRSYYEPFLEYFKEGNERPDQHDFKIKADRKMLELSWKTVSSENKEKAFERFSKLFSKIPHVDIIRSINSNIEEIDKFYYKFDWSDLISQLNMDDDLFFSARIIFESSDFKALALLIKEFNWSVEKHFTLRQKFIFRPDKGYDDKETPIYEITISIHPCNVGNKFMFRKRINEYLDELSDILEKNLITVN